MIPFETERLIVRRWTDRDQAVFHRLNSDETVMRFYPYRRDRVEADAALDRFNAVLDLTGMTFFALEAKEDGRVVGMAGTARLDANMPRAPGVEIGWRLLPEECGKGFATETGRACRDFAFAGFDIGEIVSFCVVDNIASEAVMLRLGLERVADFDHPKVDPATHPHLVRHKLYRLSRAQWSAPAPHQT